MKKSELIKKLNEIKGDPEILLWNGFVGDYQKVSKNIVEHVFVKETQESIFKNLVFEEMRKRKSFDDLPNDLIENIKKEAQVLFKESEWDLPNEYFDEESFKSHYGKNKKKIIILDAEARGKTTSDRNGEIKY